MTLKWQQVAVGGFVSLFLLLGGILNLAGVSYSHDGDKTCTDCFSEIKLFSTFWVIKAGNYGDEPVLFKKVSRSRTLHVNLDKIDEFVETNPEVKVEILVPAIKRTSTMNHLEYGYLRPLKHGDTLIYRNNANRKAPSRIIIHGINVTGTVKWGFELEHFLMEDISIDPKWIGLNASFEYYGNGEWVCKTTKEEIVCDSVYDGNGDGICQSGESCIIKNLITKEIIRKIDTPRLRKNAVEIK